MVSMASIQDRVTDVGAYLREQRELARLSVRQLASLAGVSNPYLSQVERGLRNPSAEVLQQIAKGLRISAEALYVRAGILDADLRVGVERSVQTDPDLSDRQKRVLLDIYASFRAENARAAAEDVAAAVPRRRPSTRTTSSVPAKRAVRKAAKAARAADAADAAAERPPRPRRRAAAVAEPVHGVATAATDAPDTSAPAGRTAGGPARRGSKRAAPRTTTTRAAKRAAKAPSRATGPTPPSAGAETP